MGVVPLALADGFQDAAGVDAEHLLHQLILVLLALLGRHRHHLHPIHHLDLDLALLGEAAEALMLPGGDRVHRDPMRALLLLEDHVEDEKAHPILLLQVPRLLRLDLLLHGVRDETRSHDPRQHRRTRQRDAVEEEVLPHVQAGKGRVLQIIETGRRVLRIIRDDPVDRVDARGRQDGTSEGREDAGLDADEAEVLDDSGLFHVFTSTYIIPKKKTQFY